MGNHLTFVTDGDAIAVPSYTRALDYELELGCVLAHRLLDATPARGGGRHRRLRRASTTSAPATCSTPRCSRASARRRPSTSATPSRASSSRADEILPHWRALKGSVRINGELISEPTSADAALVAGRGHRPRVALRAALSRRVLRLRHAARRQRHRDRPAARRRRRDRDRHRPHRHAHQPHRRQRGRSHEGHRPVEAHPVQPRRPASSCR